VTTSNPDAALNFGMDEQMEHSERYARAREFYDVVHRPVGFVGRRCVPARCGERPLFRFRAKLHVLDHKGKYLKVRGPLNIARPIQGWPVMVQGWAPPIQAASFAAETAEMVFAAGGPIEAGRAFYADVKGRAVKIGRNPDHIKNPAGRLYHHRRFARGGAGEAPQARQPGELGQRHRRPLDRHPASMRASSIPTGPLPEIPETNQSKSGRERVVALARRENLTVAPDRRPPRRLRRARDHGHRPKMIADQMQEWLETGASDGFNVMFPYLPGGLDDFVNKVVPRAAAPRHLPHRVRGQDPARKPRPAAPGEPLLHDGGEGGGVGHSSFIFLFPLAGERKSDVGCRGNALPDPRHCSHPRPRCIGVGCRSADRVRTRISAVMTARATRPSPIWSSAPGDAGTGRAKSPTTRSVPRRSEMPWTR